ncbi:MAG: 3-hydroxyacyl-CoA dehydrogenase, partial [Betaproteobacteria bacterium]|nr:3-hydroxyacyl-CoA dehydrogenase [Betaproteobacteria bacterium]
VIAAVYSVAMGGGLELAMGCHYRVASPGAQIALPEVKLGVLPGAGGTQRLPRLVGLEMGLNMIVSGQTVLSERLAATRLFDQIVEGDLVTAAKAFARKAVDEGKGLPRVRDIRIEHPDAQALLQFARNTVGLVARNFPAPMKCIEAVAAAVDKPFDEAMRFERALFLELVQTPESKALRHAFFGERAASKIPDIPEDTPLREIRSAAVIGAGTMGGGIAMNFANAGIPVIVLEAKADALDKGIATIRANYENTAKKGRISPEDVATRMGLIRQTLSYDDIASADIVIEAVFEDMAVKEQVFRKLDQIMKPGAILATNTSTLNVDRIAAFTSRPQDVIGTHFFSPANVMKLLEVVRGAKTAKDVLATTMQLAKKLRKTGVVSGVCDGFIGNRMVEQYIRQAGFMLEEGALPQQVDRAIEKFGFAMGPFRMSDLAGNDVGWYIRKRRYQEQPDMKYPRIADLICEKGRFGQKTGAGFYRYETGRRDAMADPVVEQMIVDHRASIGLKPRKLSDDEIVHRLVFALVNEGAKILEEGIALRASDIDMVYLTGYGFPVHRGGPMLYADLYGLYNVAARMNEFARNPHGDPGFWTPAPLLARLVETGKGFNG